MILIFDLTTLSIHIIRKNEILAKICTYRITINLISLKYEVNILMKKNNNQLGNDKDLESGGRIFGKIIL